MSVGGGKRGEGGNLLHSIHHPCFDAGIFTSSVALLPCACGAERPYCLRSFRVPGGCFPLELCTPIPERSLVFLCTVRVLAAFASAVVTAVCCSLPSIHEGPSFAGLVLISRLYDASSVKLILYQAGPHQSLRRRTRHSQRAAGTNDASVRLSTRALGVVTLLAHVVVLLVAAAFIRESPLPTLACNKHLTFAGYVRALCWPLLACRSSH